MSNTFQRIALVVAIVQILSINNNKDIYANYIDMVGTDNLIFKIVALALLCVALLGYNIYQYKKTQQKSTIYITLGLLAIYLGIILYYLKFI